MEFREFLTLLIICSFIFSFLASISQADPIATLLTGFFSFSSNPIIYVPSFSCTGCDTGNCVCNIGNCTAGAVDFYSSADCALLPYKENIFSESRISFPISKNLYARVFCNNATASACTVIPFSGNPSFSCAACDTGTCICMASGCRKGTFDFYSTFDCSMLAYKETAFTDGSFSFPITSTVYMRIFCDNGKPSDCARIFYASHTTSTTTTTTSTTTTTTISKTICPYECCFNAESYFDKDCDEGSICANNKCYVTTTTTTGVPYQISFSLIISSFLSILLLLFLIYYVFGIVLGRRSARWVGKK